MAEPVDWKRYREDIDRYCAFYPEDNLSKGHIALHALVGEMANAVDDALSGTDGGEEVRITKSVAAIFVEILARAKEVRGG